MPPEYKLPRYDMDALMIEVELLLDWYLPRMGVEVTADLRKSYVALWRRALQPAIDVKPTRLAAAQKAMALKDAEPKPSPEAVADLEKKLAEWKAAK